MELRDAVDVFWDAVLEERVKVEDVSSWMNDADIKCDPHDLRIELGKKFPINTYKGNIRNSTDVKNVWKNKYTIIDGNIKLEDGKCQNFFYLEGIKVIKGSLNIGNMSFITDTRGLENLTLVKKNFVLRNNHYLGSLNNFNSLKYVRGNFTIINNSKLNFIKGFNKLLNIYCNINIYNNKILSTIYGFNELESFLAIKIRGRFNFYTSSKKINDYFGNKQLGLKIISSYGDIGEKIQCTSIR